MVGVDLLFKPDTNLLTRIGSSPNLGFFGIMAVSSCVLALVIFFIPLLGVNMDLFQESLWTEPCSNLRGLKRPGILEFCPKTVQTSTIAKLCSLLGRSQCLAILEWGLVNPEKIAEFLDRM